MAGSAGQNEDMIEGINVTPLVDITLVLLIIFIATSSIIVKAEMGMELPDAVTAEDREPGGVMVSIDTLKLMMLNGNPVNSSAELRQLLTDEAKRDPKVKVIISADQHLKYEDVATVIDAVRKAGISSFSLDVQKIE
jgi:biopolymer transport protein ExbD